MVKRVRAMRSRRPPPPKWLVDKVSRAFWNQLHDDLTVARFLAATDHAELSRYCQYMAEWVQLTNQIQTEGWTYTTSSEHVEDMRRPNPAVRFRKDVEGSLMALEDRIGLNPRARMAITQALLAISVLPRDPDHARDLLDGAGGAADAPDVVDSQREWEGLLSHGGKAN